MTKKKRNIRNLPLGRKEELNRLYMATISGTTGVKEKERGVESPLLWASPPRIRLQLRRYPFFPVGEA